MEIITEQDTTKTISGLPAPADWHVIESRVDGLAWERLIGQRITVIESVRVESDGRRWLHVSVSKTPSHKLPTYDDLQTARKLFVGEHRECYQIFPPKSRYVNFCPVLHLFACLDQPGGVLPQFDATVLIDGKEVRSV